MITPWIAATNGLVLIIAALMELCNARQARFIGMLAAFGFVMLGLRYFYLVHTGDLARLNIFGTASIGAIALARILACADDWRKPSGGEVEGE